MYGRLNERQDLLAMVVLLFVAVSLESGNICTETLLFTSAFDSTVQRARKGLDSLQYLLVAVVAGLVPVFGHVTSEIKVWSQ